MKRHCFLIVLNAFFLLVPALLLGQTTATISGVVRDSSGGVVPGAGITIHNTGTGTSRTLQSDAQGRYIAPDLSLGTYELQLEAAGFRKEVRTGIVLTVGEHPVINFTLSP